MVLPNFIIIGAQKAGTTALAEQMGNHPQIYISPIKEPGFFDFENSPPAFCGPGDQELYNHMLTDIDAYRALFSEVADEQAIGEATTWYLYSKRAPELIHRYIPTVKLIAVLRNPIDRAYSAYLHARRDGREPVVDFSKALDLEEERTAQNWEYLWRYKQMGMYSEQIRRYFDLFPKDNIRVYLHEDCIQHSEQVIGDICDFLGVDKTLMPDSKQLNASGIPQNRLVHELLSGPNLLRKLLKPLVPSAALREQIRLKIKNRNLKKPQMPPDARNQLASFYEADILALEQLLDRDLSGWLQS